MDDKNYTFRIAIESLWTSMRLTGKRGLRVGLDIRWGRASEITASDSGQEVAHSMGFRLSRGTGKPDG